MGLAVGLAVGSTLGFIVGLADGTVVGFAVGLAVGYKQSTWRTAHKGWCRAGNHREVNCN